MNAAVYQACRNFRPCACTIAAVDAVPQLPADLLLVQVPASIAIEALAWFVGSKGQPASRRED